MKTSCHLSHISIIEPSEMHLVKVFVIPSLSPFHLFPPFYPHLLHSLLETSDNVFCCTAGVVNTQSKAGGVQQKEISFAVSEWHNSLLLQFEKSDC